jgi:hypothetical protein
LERGGPNYDLIALDAFATESPPYQLFSREALSAMHRRLEPQGIVVIDIVSILGSPGNEAWLSAYKTIGTVFPEVRAFAGSDDYAGLANVLIFSSDGPLTDGGASRQARPFAANDIRAMLSRELVPSRVELARVRVLTDDYAPMESLLAKTATRWRRSLQASIPDVMLY